MSDVGDTETLTLTVSPHDGTTAATVQVTSPTGVVSSPSAATADGGATWTAELALTAAGAWTIVWTVTGTGAGAQSDTVYAFAPVTGRTYATLSDLAAYQNAIPEDGSDRLLVQATRLVDMMLIGAVYPVDDDGMPTTAAHIQALADATCAQVEWMVETGDAIGDASRYQSTSIGRVSVTRGYTTRGSTTGDAQRYAPDAQNILRLAGLLPIRGPYVYG